MLKVIAALGNPGKPYASTRHNAGWMLVDAYAAKKGLAWKFEARFNAEVAAMEQKGEKLWLIKPQTYMNLSGQAIGAFLAFYKLPATSLMVVHDEVAFDCGTTRLSYAGSPGGHNGIASIAQALGSEDFWRLRLGVGPRNPDFTLADWVLSELPNADAERLKEEKTLAILDLIVDIGPQKAQNGINQNITSHGQASV